MATKKGKDFSKSLGRKNMSTLIPTNDTEPILPIKSNEQKKAVEKEKVKDNNDMVVMTFRIKKEYHETIKAIAFWDRKKIQDVFDEAIATYLEQIPNATMKKAVEEYEKRK